jgi:hypothetical protein
MGAALLALSLCIAGRRPPSQSAAPGHPLCVPATVERRSFASVGACPKIWPSAAPIIAEQEGNHDQVVPRLQDVIAGIATAIGLLVASVGLVVAPIQIREPHQLNRANDVDEIQSDARQLAWQLMSDPVLAGAVYGPRT